MSIEIQQFFVVVVECKMNLSPLVLVQLHQISMTAHSEHQLQ
jgi:hypothetical protein